MKSELNARQWALYNFLKNNPDCVFTQKEIAERLGGEYAADVKDYHSSRARVLMTKDIREINNSDIIQKIIISNNHGVKLASREEFEKYINAEYAAIFRKLARTRKKAMKGGLNGQIRFTFGNERDTVEAFGDSINRLKAARLNKGLKLADVVRILKPTEKYLDISLLSKMENGHCKPTETLLLKLSEIYGVDASYLVGGEFVGEDIIA